MTLTPLLIYVYVDSYCRHRLVDGYHGMQSLGCGFPSSILLKTFIERMCLFALGTNMCMDAGLEVTPRLSIEIIAHLPAIN